MEIKRYDILIKNECCFFLKTIESIHGSSVTYPEIWRSPCGDATSPYGNAASLEEMRHLHREISRFQHM